MLKRFHVRDFRSCKDVTLDQLEGMTALVGLNGSGKTNLLKAIEWLARSVAGKSTLFLTHGSSPGSPTFEAEILDEAGNGYRYTAIDDIHFQESIHQQTAGSSWKPILKRTDYAVRLVGSRESMTLGPGPTLPALEALLSPNDERLSRLRPVLRFFAGVQYCPADQSNQLRGFDKDPLTFEKDYLQWKLEPELDESVVMRLIDSERNGPSQLAELKSLLGKKGLNLIGDVSIGPLNATRKLEEKLLVVHFRVNGQFLAFHDLSVGTRRIVQILTALILDQPSLLMIEHPEDGLHPGLLRKLLGILRSYSDTTQVIVTSHSPLVVNMLEPSQVRLVTMSKGQTAVRPLDGREARAASRYLEEEGTLAEFLEAVQEG